MKPVHPNDLLNAKLSFKCTNCGKAVEQTMKVPSDVDAYSSLLSIQAKREIHDCGKGQFGLMMPSVVSVEAKPQHQKGE